IPLATRDFPVHEKVLELLAATEPNRTKTVTRAAISYGQTSLEQVATHARHRSDAQRAPPFRRLAAGRRRLSWHAAPCARHDTLSWDRQRNAEKVRLLCRGPPDGASRPTC